MTMRWLLATSCQAVSTSASATTRGATVKAPASELGSISSMDLVTATSAILAAIEAPEPTGKLAKAASPAVASKLKKRSVLRLATKGHAARNHG